VWERSFSRSVESAEILDERFDMDVIGIGTRPALDVTSGLRWNLRIGEVKSTVRLLCKSVLTILVLFCSSLSNRSGLFAQDSGMFVPAGNMTMPRRSPQSIRLLNGKVLISSGEFSGGRTIGSAEIYDPATATFTVVPDWPVKATVSAYSMMVVFWS